MNESIYQISPESVTAIFRICAAISVGIIVLLAFVCSIGIGWQMFAERGGKRRNSNAVNRCGLTRD